MCNTVKRMVRFLTTQGIPLQGRSYHKGGIQGQLNLLCSSGPNVNTVATKRLQFACTQNMNTMCTNRLNTINRVLPHLQSNSCLRGKIDHEAAPVRMLFRVQWTNATHHLYAARITVRHGCFSSLAAAASAVTLVSLSCRVLRASLRGSVSGWSYPARRRPTLLKFLLVCRSFAQLLVPPKCVLIRTRSLCHVTGLWPLERSSSPIRSSRLWRDVWGRKNAAWVCKWLD